MRKTTKIDMHLHTRGSDGLGSPKQIAKAAKAAGLDAICITDHHRTYTLEGLAVANECRAHGIRVFHGCEYSTDDGHLLIYGVDVEELELGRYPPMQRVIDAVNAAGGVAVPSHPYKGYKRLLGDAVYSMEGLAGIEVANGQVAVANPSQNADAKAAAKSLELAQLGGSDAHVARNIGTCYTVFRGVIETTNDLVAAIKSGKCKAVVNRKKVTDGAKAWARRVAARKVENTPRPITGSMTALGADLKEAFSRPNIAVLKATPVKGGSRG